MAHARFPSLELTDLLEVTHDPARLTAGVWAVVVTFEGELTAARFDRVCRAPAPAPTAPWQPLAGEWHSSLDRAAYLSGVEEIRRRVSRGELYQANLCRVMSHRLSRDADLDGLAALLDRGNPAPRAGRIHLPDNGIDLVCASPEAYLLRHGELITSRPIKGTSSLPGGMLPKDYAENVMIADLVRNDLSRCSRPGTVVTQELCVEEEHPGLVHLVTTISGRLEEGADWPEILTATFPPGSVSGAPKSSALVAIDDLETRPRGPYCGAIGWVDADRMEADLAVGIRTFWAEGAGEDRQLCFGVGAGITWGSDPEGEWEETRLKAARLVGLASGRIEA
ncbi:chorismate-binding protein [Actinomycetota bacterium]